ncbi:hypothetical protein AgCh_038566 [Apium graveolens]
MFDGGDFMVVAGGGGGGRKWWLPVVGGDNGDSSECPVLPIGIKMQYRNPSIGAEFIIKDRQSKKYAVVVQMDDTSDCVGETSSDPNDIVSLSQYNQLLSMYNQKNYQIKNDSNGKISLLAGPFLEKATYSSWYVTSGLYSLQFLPSFDSSTPCCNAAKATSITEAYTWHQKMGHLPFSQLKVIFPALQSYVNDSVCQICSAARQVK